MDCSMTVIQERKCGKCRKNSNRDGLRAIFHLTVHRGMPRNEQAVCFLEVGHFEELKKYCSKGNIFGSILVFKTFL